MNTNLKIAALALLLVGHACAAETTYNRGDQQKLSSAKEQSVASASELMQAVKSVKGVVTECYSVLSSALIVNDFKKKIAAPASPEKRVASDERIAIYEENRQCKDSGKEKIRDISPFIVNEFGKRGLRDLGKDYLVQAHTCLDAVGNDSIYSAEFSKLNSLRNRIEIELSPSNSK